MHIKFIRYSERVHVPKRAYPSDTGCDIFMPDGGTICPHETLCIPTGFGIDVPNGYNARLQVRTSVAKKGIIVQGCAIDAGYTGEIHIIMHNMSNKPFDWRPNDRLCYIEVYPCVYPEFVEEEIEQRKTNGIGSTGV